MIRNFNEGSKLRVDFTKSPLRYDATLKLIKSFMDFQNTSPNRSLFAKAIGCHGIPERCLRIGNHQMTICARCTGLLIGYTIAIPLIILFIKINLYLLSLGVILVIPMAIDGITQLKTQRESNNRLRLITGIFGGMGQLMFLVLIGLLLIRFLFFIFALFGIKAPHQYWP